MPPAYDIVVAGAGPAGAAAARACAESGLSVLCIEEQGSIGYPVQCAGLLSLAAFDECAVSRRSIQNTVTGARVDEIAYDPGLHVAYCASRQGKISCVAVAAGKLTTLGDVPDETGTGDIAVDPKTHIVWIAYKKGGQAFVQPYVPAK